MPALAILEGRVHPMPDSRMGPGASIGEQKTNVYGNVGASRTQYEDPRRKADFAGPIMSCLGG